MLILFNNLKLSCAYISFHGNNPGYQSEYGNSKLYPIFPRYTMLKDMIKDIMHDPDYMEVCHEVDN